MAKGNRSTRTFIDPPPYSDGKNGKAIIKQKGLEIVDPDQLKYLRYFATLGERLTGKQDTALERLPTGYAMGRKGDHKVLAGHPSGRVFSASVLFLPHLKWLYASSDGKQVPCECQLCKTPSRRVPNDRNRKQSIMVEKSKPRRFNSDQIYGPLRPMDKVLIHIPHENDPPIPGCISIPHLVSVPKIENKLHPQYEL
ncbi:hypothetical protein K492DRAFT_208730 [Lichtheimia hyalospora FSU 10163]|nr:hypothetical protein K492DRAFT_208730 [Lichtheimia hyalospora FSU 10163]